MEIFEFVDSLEGCSVWGAVHAVRNSDMAPVDKATVIRAIPLVSTVVGGQVSLCDAVWIIKELDPVKGY